MRVAYSVPEVHEEIFQKGVVRTRNVRRGHAGHASARFYGKKNVQFEKSPARASSLWKLLTTQMR